VDAGGRNSPQEDQACYLSANGDERERASEERLKEERSSQGGKTSYRRGTSGDSAAPEREERRGRFVLRNKNGKRGTSLKYKDESLFANSFQRPSGTLRGFSGSRPVTLFEL